MKAPKGLLAFATISVLLLSSASAWDDLQRMQTAQALGNVLGSEQACGLQYDQGAIQRYVADTVPASDMQFTSQLMLMTQGSELQIRDMSASAKAAHCAQTERVARNYGFVD